MNLTIAIDNRFIRTPNGAVWTPSIFAYPFWTRYLAMFDQVRVVACVRDVPVAEPAWKRVNGEGVSVAGVPSYVGPWQYLLQAPQIQRAAQRAVGANDAVILRVSAQIANCIEPYLRQTGHPYGVEVVGDPYDVFAPGAMRHPLRPFFRWLFTHRLRGQCARACAAAYVTQFALQRRYPPAKDAFSTYYSDVELPASAFRTAPRSSSTQTSFTLITVGTLAQLYKAPHILIEAVATCIQTGLDLKLVFVGDGKYRSVLEAQVAKLGLEGCIHFRGQLPAGQAIWDQLDQADLFVLPSYQEGLPRAMIEAMARGLPCIGSTVGGIPELLPQEDLVQPGDSAALAAKIYEVVTNPEHMVDRSARNLQKAKNYQEQDLSERRMAFYRAVKDATETWLSAYSQTLQSSQFLLNRL